MWHLLLQMKHCLFLTLLLRSQKRKYALSGGDVYRYQRFIERLIAVRRCCH